MFRVVPAWLIFDFIAMGLIPNPVQHDFFFIGQPAIGPWACLRQNLGRKQTHLTCYLRPTGGLGFSFVERRWLFLNADNLPTLHCLTAIVRTGPIELPV